MPTPALPTPNTFRTGRLWRASRPPGSDPAPAWTVTLFNPDALTPVSVPDQSGVFTTAIFGLGKALTNVLEALRAAGGALDTWPTSEANTPAHVEGQAALFRVRAALDPAYSTPETLHTLISAIMTHPGALSPALTLMSRENRAHVAAAALAGWARHRPGADRPALTFGGLVEHHVVRRHTFTVTTDVPGGASEEKAS